MAQQIVDMSSSESLELELRAELEQSRKALKETSMMVEQSQAELVKLTQRNTVVTSHMQQIQLHMDTLPKDEIRTAYKSAFDAQQRLLVMKGQLDKLQSDKANLENNISNIEKALQLFGEISHQSTLGAMNQAATLETLINSQEAVRQRLSRQMHDGPAQALSNFIVQAEIAARLFELDPNKARDELTTLKDTALSTFQKVKAFIFELRPMMLDDLGLFPTMSRYKDSFKEQTGIDVIVTIKGNEKRFEPFIDVMIFRAVQELMGNTYRYNMDAASKVVINVNFVIDESMIRVSVNDNGKGFDPEAALSSEGFGLRLIRERVEMLGGTMSIESAVGQGSQISFEMPIQEMKKTDHTAIAR